MHPLSTVSMPGTRSEHPLKRTRSALHPCQAHARSALYPCQAHGKNTRSSAPAQHCIHARHMVRTPAQVHPLSTVSMPGTRSEHPLKRTRSALHPCQAHARSALYPCQAHGKNTRSSAPAQHCIHARHMVRTPAQVHPLNRKKAQNTFFVISSETKKKAGFELRCWPID